MCLPNPQKQVQKAQQQFQQEQLDLQQQQAAEAKAQQDKLNAEEAQRQSNITAGKSAIDNAFSQFNDDYYTHAQDDYRDALLPDLTTQYDTSKDKLTAALKERGTLESTIGANALGDLFKRYTDQQTKVGSDAVGFSNNLRSSVDASKSNLYNLNQTAADPNMIQAQATGAATNLVQAPGGNRPSPVGNVFTDLLTPFVYTAAARANPSYGFTPTAPIGGSGSARVFG